MDDESLNGSKSKTWSHGLIDKALDGYIAIIGPTASGKSDLAMQLAEALQDSRARTVGLPQALIDGDTGAILRRDGADSAVGDHLGAGRHGKRKQGDARHQTENI